MKIDDIFNIKGRGKVVTGTTLWEDNISYKIGDILVCRDKKWQVIAIDHFRQGCFGIPITRIHSLQLKPIDHEDQPDIGDDLVIIK